MAFRPNVHDELTLNGVTYRIAEHPAAPGIPYGQEGRAGIVYQLLPSPTGRGVGGEGAMALKVFRARFRTPALVSQAEKLAAFADLPGLTVCRRTVLTPQRNADLLRREPDLTYAVLMPWIEGPTWVEVMLEKRPLTPQQALDLARAFADILSRMEQNGIAHCDLSGPNVLLPMLAQPTADRRPQTAYRPPSTVELVDVEGLYAPGLPRPEALPSGSSGYAHRTAREGLWGPTADRFAGAVLLAEMLGWGDESVREACYGETYFDPAEMPSVAQASACDRYQTLLSALARHYGQPVADLFERAWTSETLADCPTFGEWLVALPEQPVAQAFSLSTATTETAEAQASTSPEEVTLGVVRGLMQAARRMEDKGNLEGALELYRQALELAGADPSLRSLAREIELTVQDVEKRVAAQASRPQPAVEIPAPPSVSPLSLGEGPELKEQPRHKTDWRPLLLLWFSTVGSAVGGWLSKLVFDLLNSHPASIFPSPSIIVPSAAVASIENGQMVITVDFGLSATIGTICGIVFGVITGFFQWLVLRRYLSRAGWWIVASAVGWAVGIALSWIVHWDDVGFVAIGAIVGAVQWLILRRQVRRAGWWILASAVGWAVSWGAVGMVLGGVWGGGVGGQFTGAVLVWLLRQPRREEERKSQPE
jgi:hypothetical protein